MEIPRWNVVLVGLGSVKVASRFSEHLQLQSSCVVATDEDKTSYKALHWGSQPEMMKGISASSEAKEKLEKSGQKTQMWLIGAGLTSAAQNGGVVCVDKNGKTIPFAYRSDGSWDMPDMQVLRDALPNRGL